MIISIALVTAAQYYRNISYGPATLQQFKLSNDSNNEQ